MIPEEAVTFGPPGGPTLHGVLAIPPGASRGVVVCHPHPLYGGDMDNVVVRAVAEACRAGGLATLRFDFRGVRRSGGIHDDGVGEQDDVGAALDLLQARLQAPPALAGYSFGAAVAAAVAGSGRALAGVALVAPPDGVPARAGPTRPFIVVAGSEDHVCSAGGLAAWRAALPDGAVHVIPGADHFFSTGLAAMGTALTGWTARLTATTGGAGAAAWPCPRTG